MHLISSPKIAIKASETFCGSITCLYYKIRSSEQTTPLKKLYLNQVKDPGLNLIGGLFKNWLRGEGLNLVWMTWQLYIINLRSCIEGTGTVGTTGVYLEWPREYLATHRQFVLCLMELSIDSQYLGLNWSFLVHTTVDFRKHNLTSECISFQ